MLNHKRTERVYREEQLALRKSRRKKQAVIPRKPAKIINGPDGRVSGNEFRPWQSRQWQKHKDIGIIDLWDRKCPGLTVGFSQTGQSVTTMDSLKDQAGLPRRIRTDNGPEFTCNALKVWAEKNGVVPDTTRPGKPTDNGHMESFNGRLRDERRNQHIFENLEDAREKISEWMEYMRHVRMDRWASLRQPPTGRKTTIARK